MLKYKVNVIDLLKQAGYSTYRIRKDKLLSESALQSLRTNNPIAWESIEIICELLDCQPSDIIESVKRDQQEDKK